MIGLILLILVLLWLLGYSPYEIFPIQNLVLFQGPGRDITLFDLLVFGLIIWLAGLLPRPFREIAIVILLLWIVSALGIIALSGNVIIIVLIVGLIVYLFQNRGLH